MNFDTWRTQARALLRAGIAPHDVSWETSLPFAPPLHHRTHADDAQAGDSREQTDPDERLKQIVQQHPQPQDAAHVLADLARPQTVLPR